MNKLIINLVFLLSISMHAMEYQNFNDEDYIAFKKEYINCYFPEVKENKESLLEHAPSVLRQWFEEIKKGKHPLPMIISGAPGVGKTMTSQALVQDANCVLCYIQRPANMHKNRPDRFEKKYLQKIDENVCIVLDNIIHLEANDVDNWNALVRMCEEKKNLHLLAIVYNARYNKPLMSHNKFRICKFLHPEAKERSKLFKSIFERVTFASDVDEQFLENFITRIPYGTARIIENIQSLAVMSFREEENQSEQITLSKKHLEKGLKEFNYNNQVIEWDFLDENE